MESDTALDAIDLQLPGLLQRDASLSNQALAQRVHVSPPPAPTCLRRVRRLRGLSLIERQGRYSTPSGWPLVRAAAAGREIQRKSD